MGSSSALITCHHCGQTATYWYGNAAECDFCCPNWSCQIQSEEVEAPVVDSSTVTNDSFETTSFMDTTAITATGVPALPSILDTSDAITDAGLTDFLSRPVRIANYTWGQSDPVGVWQTLSPWQLFFNNANIKYKLNNFAFLRANLKIRIIVNASPFYYGSIRACYQPLPNFKPSTISYPLAFGALIPYSQQPGVWVKPSSNEGAEMTLPFFYPRSYLRAQVAQDFLDMGTLRLNIYNVLRSANGVTGAGVSVQVYAWAEDVLLAGPSVGLALQSDEYGMGAVSGPASTVAEIASKLKNIPVIGKFATATEMGARAVSGIAKLFGFTNVPVIEDVRPMKPAAFPSFATAEIGYPVEKLTLDPKNELTIDPSALGLPAYDELAIASLATRESWLCNTNWSTGATTDTILFTANVNPMYGIFSTVTGSAMVMTPLALLSRLFQNWRGDIIFTFRFIASPFHKGRVRISYDPYGSGVVTATDTGPTVYNQIVDLGKDTEVEVRIPYQQALAWCYSYYNDDNPTLFSTSSTPSLTYTDTYDNGMISMKVLTALTAPVAASSIDIQVFVRGADNFEFANPKILQPIETALQVQSEEYSETVTGEEANVGKSVSQILPERLRVNFGEAVGSLRLLLRRTNMVDVTQAPSVASQAGIYAINQTRHPPYYGYDPNGLSTARGIVTPANTYNFNFTAMQPYHYIANCFVAQRGSQFWHYNWVGLNPTTLRVVRDTTPGAPSSGWIGGAYGTTSNGKKNYLTWQKNTAAGASLVNQRTNAGVSVGLPNYTVFKFQTTDPLRINNPAANNSSAYDGSNNEWFTVETDFDATADTLQRCRIERYSGVGTDFGLYFFLNCPTLYRLPLSAITPV